MRKSLKKTLTGSMVLTAAVSMVIVSCCLLLGMLRYGSTQFSDDVAEVLSTELITELNTASVGSPESAAVSVEQVLEANAGHLGIGTGREYSIWDVSSGNCVGGTAQDVAMTNNIIAAMRGEVGDSISMFAAQMDIAIPINGETLLVLDIMDDGSAMRTLCWNTVVLLLAAFVLSMLASVLLGRLFAGAFAQSAEETAQQLRAQADTEDAWLALALQEPSEMQTEQPVHAPALDSIVPYISDGYVKFTADGTVLEMSAAAEQLLQVSFDAQAPCTFSEVFRGVPMPQEQNMVHGQFTQAGVRLDVHFVRIEADVFAALIRPADRGTV